MHTIGRYSIKDLEKMSGIKAHTIRIWEKRYGIIKPKRTDTNIRYYSNEDLRMLLNISQLNKHGYKISSISEMSSTEIVKRLHDLSIVKPNHDNYQESLLHSMIEMNEMQFNKVFLGIVVNMGFEKAIGKVIFPFFERIGIMWQTGTINPAQEHFISNVVRQKIIVATDSLTVFPQPDAKMVLLFLPETEMHELALLFYNYMFRSRGYKTIYLGQAVPQDSLDRVASICDPDYVVTGMTNSIAPKAFETWCRQLSKAFGTKTVFFTGPVPPASGVKLPKNALLVDDLISFLGMDK